MRRLILLPLFLVATSLLAQPVVMGISPTEGPTAGGTEVTITGSGFGRAFMGAEILPVVYFGDVRARTETLVNHTTILATAPAWFGGSVRVTVKQYNGTATSSGSFTFLGEYAAAVERFLLPIFVKPIPGAYGSEFRSELSLWNPSRWLAAFGGFPPASVVCGSCPVGFELGPGASTRVYDPYTALGRPGRFIDVNKDAAEDLTATLRVFDTSRSATNLGTEIPVVPVRAFRQTITLTGIPTDPRFRLMLRVYGASRSPGGVVSMAFAGETRTVHLRTGADSFDPPYAELALAVPSTASASHLNLRLDSLSPAGDIPPAPIWAFITVTNNETQHITTITPQSVR